MKTQCPKCGYEGDIKDNLIPEGGRTVGCPQCKTTFIVERGNTEKGADTNSSAPREVEVDGRDFIPYRHRETRATGQRADRPVTRIVVLALSFSAVFVIGLFIGRYTHNYSLTNPLKQGEVTPAVLMTPTSPVDDRTEIPAPPDVIASPVETPDTDVVGLSEPLILEESFTSDVFLDITEIDGKLKEATEITGLQRELELKEFAGSLVGKVLVGYFVVRDVGKLNSPYAKILPLTLYNYYLEAEGDSADPVKSVVYVGLKEADELSSSLDKGSTVYIQGFIYSCTLVFDHFEMGIVNPKVELSR